MSAASLDELLISLGCERLGAPTPDPLPDARAVGFFHPSLPLSVQVFGSAADAFVSPRPWSAQLPRTVVLGCDANPGDWLQRLSALGVAGYRSAWPAARIVDRLRLQLAMPTSPQHHLHATLVQVYGLGVLLLGSSGAGKSELALDLVARGHALVADDGVEVCRPAAGCLLGRCPESFQGFIEVRGLGILDLRAAYGQMAVTAATRIDLAIRIDQADAYREPMERLHGRRQPLDLLEVVLPEVLLPPRLGHNAVMVEAACRDHWLRLRGYVASQAFEAAHDRLTAGTAAGDVRRQPRNDST